MLHYFYVLKRAWMHSVLRPALAESRRRRSFVPCVPLCQELAAGRSVPADAVLRAILQGARYDKVLWHALIDECLIVGADDMPRIPCMIDALGCLLQPRCSAQERLGRDALTPIDQVYFGARDLRLGGGWHRPEHVGWNDADDVARLSAYLDSIQPETWSAAALAPMADFADDGEREEELAYVRDWWPTLTALYRQARHLDQIIVCERP